MDRLLSTTGKSAGRSSDDTAKGDSSSSGDSTEASSPTNTTGSTSFSSILVGGLMGKLKRRATVKITGRKILLKAPSDRTDADVDAIVTLTNRSSYFHGMDRDLHRNIARVLCLQEFKPHEVIMTEGDIPGPDACFYIVLSGMINIYQRPPDWVPNSDQSRPSTANSVSLKAARETLQSAGLDVPPDLLSETSQHNHKHGDFILRLGAGSHFGERALLSSEARSATITAFKSKLELLVLRRQDYERLLASRDRKELMEITNALENCLLAADVTGSGVDLQGSMSSSSDSTSSSLASSSTSSLSRSDVNKLTYYVEWRTAAPGQEIISQGCPADRLIFFVEGRAAVQLLVRGHTHSQKLELANISTAGPRSTFGASEFVSGKVASPKYAVTLRALTYCRYLILSRSHLARIQKQVTRALRKCAVVDAMRRIFWFHRLSEYHLLPGLEDSINPHKELPQTSIDLYEVVRKAMERAHSKDIKMKRHVHKKLQHHTSSLAHHAWPFASTAKSMQEKHRLSILHKEKRGTSSLKESLNNMYRDEISLVWRTSKRRHLDRQKFGSGHTSSENDSMKASRLVKEMCDDGAFEILQDLETRIKSILVDNSRLLGVTEAALRASSGVLQCRSPAKARVSQLQRFNDREAELEAELAGIDAELSNRGISTSQNMSHDPHDDCEDIDQDFQISDGKRLQPHMPHVLHDLPLVFGQASKYSSRGPQRLKPLMGSSHQLKTVPKGFEVLWPKPKVKAPHYPSADPSLLTEFVGHLGESLIE